MTAPWGWYLRLGPVLQVERQTGMGLQKKCNGWFCKMRLDLHTHTAFANVPHCGCVCKVSVPGMHLRTVGMSLQMHSGWDGFAPPVDCVCRVVDVFTELLPSWGWICNFHHTVKASMNAAATAAPWRPFSKAECAPGWAPTTSICSQYDGGIAERGLCVTLEVFSA